MDNHVAIPQQLTISTTATRIVPPFGLGYRSGNFYLDAAFLYQTQSADMYAFHYNSNSRATENELPAQQLNLRRSTVTLTAGFRF